MRSIRFVIGFLLILVLSTCTKFGKNITVKGRVLNPITGEGVAGMEIWLQKTTLGLPGGNKTIKSVTTDAGGNFELDKLTLSSPVILVNSHGLYHEIGWWTGSTYSSFLKLPAKKGKTMHVDYHVVPYGEIKISLHNINCQGPNDTLIYKRNYVSTNGFSIFQPLTLTGCYDNDGAFAKVPSGNYSIEWTVIRNGISNSYSHILNVPANGQAIYNIDY